MSGTEPGEVDALRLRSWRERSSRSRATGIVLLLASVVLFAVAYVLPVLAVEVASITSFVVGVYLLTYEAQARVRIYPASMTALGPIRTMAAELEKAAPPLGQAVYVPKAGGVVMALGRSNSVEVPPPGHGLIEAYEGEIGPLEGAGTGKAFHWLPKVMVDGLGLARDVAMEMSGNEAVATAERPFVKPLCLDEFMAAKICGTIGCPLMASVAEALAKSSTKPVRYMGCSYDPATQVATSRHQFLY